MLIFKKIFESLRAYQTNIQIYLFAWKQTEYIYRHVQLDKSWRSKYKNICLVKILQILKYVLFLKLPRKIFPQISGVHCFAGICWQLEGSGGNTRHHSKWNCNGLVTQHREHQISWIAGIIQKSQIMRVSIP